jgi:NADH-quinone oxidoreductase subunit L
MTHAFFKALLFLCSGSVIHAMAGEQDMRRMGGLRKHLPITFLTMIIGTLAIAGVPPLAGFFSKDEILLKAFLGNKVLWVTAVVTALMTAFYMYRLISLTFFGEYRGPAWGGHDEAAHAGDQVDHGHGVWHGPHESPRAMTVPLMALAVGAIVAGLVGIPAVLGGNNAIEHFLEPSFTVSAAVHADAEHEAPAAAASHEGAAEGAGHAISGGAEVGLMAFSVAIALFGIFMAYRFYVQNPQISEGLAQRWPRAHRVLLNKYYVDEAYDATVISGTMGGARGLWTIDRTVVDGAVNSAGTLTVIAAWFSSLTDRSVVDGVVNLVGRTAEKTSFTLRRMQTGLIQNYALLMLFGVFAFVTALLFAK